MIRQYLVRENKIDSHENCDDDDDEEEEEEEEEEDVGYVRDAELEDGNGSSHENDRTYSAGIWWDKIRSMFMKTMMMMMVMIMTTMMMMMMMSGYVQDVEVEDEMVLHIWKRSPLIRRYLVRENELNAHESCDDDDDDDDDDDNQ